jgi:multicomponent Na+:H+ antiporter subunit B
MSDESSGSAADEPRAPYVESPIIMTTVRVITPFVFTFGLFVMFHGADSAGGGFQGGVIVGTVVLMLGIAFGIETTRNWIGPQLPIGVISLGFLAFLLTGFGSVLLGGAFLEYTAYDVPDASKYGIELVEVGIGLVVSGVVTGLFFVLASSIQDDEVDIQ